MLKVGTSINNGNNQQFKQKSKNSMINTNLSKVIQLNEKNLPYNMRYCDAAYIMAAYRWSMTTVSLCSE